MIESWRLPSPRFLGASPPWSWLSAVLLGFGSELRVAPSEFDVHWELRLQKAQNKQHPCDPIRGAVGGSTLSKSWETTHKNGSVASRSRGVRDAQSNEEAIVACGCGEGSLQIQARKVERVNARTMAADDELWLGLGRSRPKRQEPHKQHRSPTNLIGRRG
jgi:hypothetical protein